MNTTERWMNTEEAAAYAGNMSPEVLARAARNKKIQHGSDGRHYKFLPRHVDAYLMAKGWDGRR